MSTEILNAANVDAQKERRKTIAIIAGTMAKTFLAEQISHFTFLLADRGWDITVVTNNRQSFADFLIDERAKRFSLDTIYGTPSQRQDALLQFVETHEDIDHYLLCGPQSKNFCKDFDTIQEMGKAVFVAFWDSMRFVETKSTDTKKRILHRVALSDGAVSSFPLDQFIHEVSYIPVMNPYSPSELRQAELGGKELLLLTSGSSGRTIAVVKRFAELLETDEFFKDKRLRIVPIDKKLAKEDVLLFSELAEQYPENIFLEDFCEKPHKILDGCAGVIVVDNNLEYPKMLAVAVAKGLPALMVKGYEDYAVQNFNKGFRICRTEAETLDVEFKRFFEDETREARVAETLGAMDAQMKQSLMDHWESFLLGGDAQPYAFCSKEHVLSCCISYLKDINQVALQMYGKAVAYNGDPIVKKAKKRASRVKRRRLLSPTWIWRKVKGKINEFIDKFHIWERNRRFDYSFIELDTPTRRKMQLLIMKMYVEFERICKELNLRYYIAGGTLLGAVRHKGFIPWDDDLDVSMPRKDYDTFLECAPAMLSKEFNLNANAYPYSFSRLEILGTHMTAPLHRKGRRVFLDIIPLDCACEDEKKKQKQAKLNEKLIFNMCEHARRVPQLYWKNRAVVFRRIWLKLFATHKGMNKRWTKNAKKYYSDDAKNWVCLPGEYGYDGETFPKEYWGEPVWMEFEGLLVPGMQEYDAYLTAHYGDYMQAPPISQRGMKHNIFTLSLGKYEDMTVEEIAQELSDDYFASTGKRVSFLKEAEG